MSRAWDILPPRKTKKFTKQEKKRQKRSSIYFVFFLILIAAFFIVFLGADKFSLPVTSPLPSPSESSKFEQPAPSSGGKTQKELSIKLLNGTGRVEESQSVQKTLTDSGFSITTTENALNLYDTSVVYYSPKQPVFEKYAQQIATLLKSYNAKTQKFTQETKYDIVVVIGTK